MKISARQNVPLHVLMLSTIQASPVDFDVVIRIDYAMEILRAEGRRAPLKKTNSPNFELEENDEAI